MKIKWSLTPFNSRGSGLLEFAVSGLVLAIVGVFFAQALLYMEERNEHVQVRLAVRLFDAAVRIRMAELMVANDPHIERRLQQENPFDWLQPQLGNYAGPRTAAELERADGESEVTGKDKEVKDGQWYFDTTHRIIVYHVASGRYFRSAAKDGESRWIRYRVHVISTPADDGGRRLEGARMAALEQYTWFQ